MVDRHEEINGKAVNANSIMRFSSPQVFEPLDLRKESGKFCITNIHGTSEVACKGIW